jgi:hypothetical protein
MRKIVREIQKTFAYWDIVFGEAIQWIWTDMKAIAISVVAAFLLACTATILFFVVPLPSEWVNEAWGQAFYSIPFACVSGGLFVSSAFFIIAYIPARKYDEMGGFAQLKIRAIVECPTRVFSEAWVGVRIYNDHPRIPVELCHFYFIRVTRISDGTEMLTRQGDKLTWTNGDPPIEGDKTVFPLKDRYADVLKTDHNNDRIIFCQQSTPDLYRDKAVSGEYNVVIGVKGVFAAKPFNEELEFVLVYKGGLERECRAVREVNISMEEAV